MNSPEHISFRCLPVFQPIGEFYIGALDFKDLIAIAWADIRRIAPDNKRLGPIEDVSDELPVLQPLADHNVMIESFDNDIVPVEDQGFERFLGIQRVLSPKRVEEIQRYVQNVDATFPTSILLAVSSKHAHYDEESETLNIVRHSKAAKIIDGQHRIAGLRNYTGPSFQLNVTVFIDMDLQDQAMVFATINLKQTKVNKSLAYDLYEFTTLPSPQKTCHDIARFLNYKQGSPLKNKIKMLGVAQRPDETLTQAAFVDRLLRMISHDPMRDRDIIKRRKQRKHLDRAHGNQAERQIFRNMFIDDRDTDIARILWNYFSAVQQKWPLAWAEVRRGNVLNRTTGFAALMRFLRIACLRLGKPEQVISTAEFIGLLSRIQIPDQSFTPDVYLPGSSGEKALFDALIGGDG